MGTRVSTRKKAVRVETTAPGASEIVWIDQAPLRRSMASDCTAAMARLERLRAGWHHFERKDKPAFVRWRAREFGALLSRAREVEDRLRDAQALIHEVETEMRRHFQDVHTAYQRVMFRRENPAVAMPAEETAEAGRSAAGAPRKLSEFEKEALFQEWVQKFLGTNPDKMDDQAYSTTFEVFKSHMFFAPREEPRKTSVRRGREKARTAADPDTDHDPEHEYERAVDPRVKELYRKLVRRLHPDLRADGNAAVSAIWHEVQEAYAASDVARMEILLALSEMEADRLGEETSLFQMRAVLAELDRSWRALEKSLQEAEGEDAWDFARTGPSEDLRVRVERQLKRDLAGRMERLELLTQTIASWARGPALNPRVGLRQRPSPG
jgi:hypothetical protein